LFGILIVVLKLAYFDDFFDGRPVSGLGFDGHDEGGVEEMK
jgi:hypothetical protein